MTSFDQLVQHLNSNQRRALKIQEKLSQSYSKIEDAKAWLLTAEKQGSHKNVVLWVQKGFQLILEKNQKEMEQCCSSDSPSLKVVTGAPGSGKSHLSQQLLEKSQIFLSADEIKKQWMIWVASERSAQNQQSTPWANEARWTDAVYMHRLTSDLSWSLCRMAIELKKSIVLEMLGANAQEDAPWYDQCNAQGYQVSVHHVATSTQQALNNAISRYFDPAPNNSDKGRYISIVELVDTQLHIMQSFLASAQLANVPHKYYLYNNSGFQMKLQAQWESNKVPDEMFDLIQDLHQAVQAPKELWFKGANHTVDFVVLSPDHSEVLLIQRGQEPFLNAWALPGGFVDTQAEPDQEFILGLETPLQAAYRELEEETFLPQGDLMSDLVEIGIFDDKNRDPRNRHDRWATSTAFMVTAKTKSTTQAGDDASNVEWVKLEKILNNEKSLAFDHLLIINKAVEFLKKEKSRGTNTQMT